MIGGWPRPASAAAAVRTVSGWIGGPVAELLPAATVRALLGCTGAQLKAWRQESLPAQRDGKAGTWWIRRDDLEQFLVARGERSARATGALSGSGDCRRSVTGSTGQAG